jgi:MbtH protein
MIGEIDGIVDNCAENAIAGGSPGSGTWHKMIRYVAQDERIDVATNPFEDEEARYLVLINDEGQHSLWPVFADVPEGWEIIFGEEGRQECLDFIEKNWTDMRPNSLIKAMEADAAARNNGASVAEKNTVSS